MKIRRREYSIATNAIKVIVGNVFLVLRVQYVKKQIYVLAVLESKRQPNVKSVKGHSVLITKRLLNATIVAEEGAMTVL